MVFDCEGEFVHPEWDNLKEKLNPDHSHHLLKDNEVCYATSLQVRSIQNQGNSWLCLVDLFSIRGGWGLVWPHCATYSNGTGALADPQGQPHSTSLGNSLRLPASCHSSSLQTLTLSIAHTDQHTTSILKQLLLSHDPLWIGFVRGAPPMNIE